MLSKGPSEEEIRSQKSHSKIRSIRQPTFTKPRIKVRPPDSIVRIRHLMQLLDKTVSELFSLFSMAKDERPTSEILSEVYRSYSERIDPTAKLGDELMSFETMEIQKILQNIDIGLTYCPSKQIQNEDGEVRPDALMSKEKVLESYAGVNQNQKLQLIPEQKLELSNIEGFEIERTCLKHVSQSQQIKQRESYSIEKEGMQNEKQKQTEKTKMKFEEEVVEELIFNDQKREKQEEDELEENRILCVEKNNQNQQQSSSSQLLNEFNCQENQQSKDKEIQSLVQTFEKQNLDEGKVSIHQLIAIEEGVKNEEKAEIFIPQLITIQEGEKNDIKAEIGHICSKIYSQKIIEQVESHLHSSQEFQRKEEIENFEECQKLMQIKNNLTGSELRIKKNDDLFTQQSFSVSQQSFGIFEDKINNEQKKKRRKKKNENEEKKQIQKDENFEPKKKAPQKRNKKKTEKMEKTENQETNEKSEKTDKIEQHEKIEKRDIN